KDAAERHRHSALCMVKQRGLDRLPRLQSPAMVKHGVHGVKKLGDVILRLRRRAVKSDRDYHIAFRQPGIHRSIAKRLPLIEPEGPERWRGFLCDGEPEAAWVLPGSRRHGHPRVL